MKYDQGDIIKIYQNTPMFINGGVAIVIDYDPNDHSYLVAKLEEVGRFYGDIQKVTENASVWVKEVDTSLINLSRPNKLIMCLKQINAKVSEWTLKLKRKLFSR